MSEDSDAQAAADSSVEQEIVGRLDAAGLAEPLLGQPDPFPSIAPSLLSADHIENYVRKTGMIAPFHLGGGRKARLKKASYEGRIGSRAYQYNEQGSLISVSMDDGVLVVPANSIVFVESGIDFRLPDYMAIRFNLQILHVHRGLLLGTGPLVDPGFWGKLCIPLHNLTDEPYTIPLDEGLIWIEFTKTTSNPRHGRDALGEPQQKAQFWDIEKFIRKAAAAPRGRAEPVAIRSSIPSMVTTANDKADAASKASEQAAKDAKLAAEDARHAAEDSEKAKSTLHRLGFGAALAGVIAIFSLLLSLASLYASYYWSIKSDIDEIQVKVDGAGAALSELKNRVSSMRNDDRAQLLEDQIRYLRNELLRLRRAAPADVGGGDVIPNPETRPVPRGADAAAPPSAADPIDAR
ncbi:hypothetical protein [Aurantimonas sp. VKM B-3413]|uniref:hypothetical protein n=1 Tax=Aurantimonas sp. VKM B-3413 TaxID=2779401 RepID=UPI001E58E345|nr:hypothetical protein [Aurantimonas sp. VKM B-3413]MCB8839499.1 hypothetical protein [Aurantimonas sp. VKM B-3413]